MKGEHPAPMQEGSAAAPYVLGSRRTSTYGDCRASAGRRPIETPEHCHFIPEFPLATSPTLWAIKSLDDRSAIAAGDARPLWSPAREANDCGRDVALGGCRGVPGRASSQKPHWR